jgi:hypothetical protein
MEEPAERRSNPTKLPKLPKLPNACSGGQTRRNALIFLTDGFGIAFAIRRRLTTRERGKPLKGASNGDGGRDGKDGERP